MKLLIILSVDIYRDEYVAALKDAIDNAYVDDLRSMADIEYNPTGYSIQELVSTVRCSVIFIPPST